MQQLHLFPESFFCHNCRRFVAHVQRTRRFRLCDACWQAIMPAWAQGRDAETREETVQIGAYWEWYGEMEKRYPARGRGRSGVRAAKVARARATDEFWPFCECGAERREYEFGTARSLFGGTRARYCPLCEARRSVEGMIGMADRIHPDWDDEAWLDALYQTMPGAFTLGVLPDYWFELRKRKVMNE